MAELGVKSVAVLGNRKVRLQFSDGISREVNLTPFLSGPAFHYIRKDRAAFAEVAVPVELGTIVWPNGAEIDADVLHRAAEAAGARFRSGS